jgi:hypothetical protein
MLRACESYNKVIPNAYIWSILSFRRNWSIVESNFISMDFITNVCSSASLVFAFNIHGFCKGGMEIYISDGISSICIS